MRFPGNSIELAKEYILSHNLMGYPDNPKMVISAVVLYLLLLSHQTGELTGDTHVAYFINIYYKLIYYSFYSTPGNVQTPFF